MSDTSFRKVSAGRGLAWVTEGFGLFKRSPGLWIGAILLWFAAAVLLSLIPLVGSLAFNLCFAMVLGGFLLAAREQDEGQTLRLQTLFAAFKPPHLEPLLLLGVAYLVIGLVMALAVVILVVLVFGTAVLSGDMQDFNLGLGAIIATILSLLMIAAFSLATWFAPGLVVFRGATVMEALKLSFKAGLGNLGALSAYGLVAIGLGLLAIIPFGLGLILLAPVMMASAWRCYRDIFGSGDEPAAEPEPSVL
ncbi:BPSS1780 family membrane protein [Solimonas sp. SE-A11]|uniref:BPSS1780 family membrane protein n=1 Tax=Solimonas sp. SE-A11 TaxID=3054954 RepID=UPI00259D0CD2|nr:BPSS1780 family membrane protein [Solimonas sp. SE-A11]MDM4769299.1 BPSS1780 family membrane protein [Solimonas sp. SE-A11]